ncbi:MAG TPA: hypothetical protein VNF24_05735 [Candidatus Acidoferrales bacterium]|nr:hypothetical protein [Candidatus Acidoferrales bacterium]
MRPGIDQDGGFIANSVHLHAGPVDQNDPSGLKVGANLIPKGANDACLRDALFDAIAGRLR